MKTSYGSTSPRYTTCRAISKAKTKATSIQTQYGTSRPNYGTITWQNGHTFSSQAECIFSKIKAFLRKKETYRSSTITDAIINVKWSKYEAMWNIPEGNTIQSTPKRASTRHSIGSHVCSIDRMKHAIVCLNVF